MFLPNTKPYALPPEEKARFLNQQIAEIVEHHRSKCEPYSRVVADWESLRQGDPITAQECPALPVSVFKQYDLKSTDDPVTVLRSSATTSGVASKIYADKATKRRQALSANKILTDFIGGEKRPYLVFDLESTVRGAEGMSARAAAILSLAHMTSEFHFVMREEAGQLRIDPKALDSALEKIDGSPFIAYGFTYILYQAHRELAESGHSLPTAHPESFLLHSGGWKKLVSLAVDKESLNRDVSQVWGLSPEKVIDFYGVIEQTGIPYPDCSAGHKHAPYWADVMIRRHDTLEEADVGETGLIQLLNCLPLSAPNHSVLTEDLGEVVHTDGCPCGRRGKAFVFKGRAPRSETRGCSDVARG